MIVMFKTNSHYMIWSWRANVSTQALQTINPQHACAVGDELFAQCKPLAITSDVLQPTTLRWTIARSVCALSALCRALSGEVTKYHTDLIDPSIEVERADRARSIAKTGNGKIYVCVTNLVLLSS